MENENSPPAGSKDGQPLDRWCGKPMAVGEFLALGIRIAAALAQAHQKGIIHKNIKPQNILLNPRSGEVQITDFSIATRLPRQYQVSETSKTIAGTPAYMSPEQTGRMNRPLDYRTDFYSLGMTFYELLTGGLPFHAADPLEWAHAHMALLPRPPSEVVLGIPPPVSEIVMKLLAKLPEERYQSAAGLGYDLEICREQWDRQGRIEPFSLGGHDVSESFQVSQGFYGREEEFLTLLAAFHRVAAGGRPELVLVSGYSGIGKSALVRELHKRLARERVFFIFGKFDQFKREIPYSTLAQALRSLVLEILAGSAESIADWKRRLQAAIGVNGQLIIEVIPQLQLVIGQQPAVPELPITEARNRFNMVFRRFLAVFSRQEHPLVLFLDDLQWADSASLELIAHLLTRSDVEYLFFIGAYRDNEVSASHPLMLTLKEAREAGASVHDIVLSSLAAEHVGRLVADSVRRRREEAEPLARLVTEKTAGNPFFVLQFLTTLHQEGLIAFDPDAASWCWDIAEIRKKNYTDNVVELMVGKLKRLPEAARNTVKLAACVGNVARASTLAALCGRTEEEVHRDLQEAIRDGLVLLLEDSYQFLHDRVQEAAYSFIPEGQRAAVHLSIGRLLLSGESRQNNGEELFDIVNQFNLGAAMLSAPDEKIQVAQLNLRAGRKAKACAAYASAEQYLAAGITLLPPRSWKDRYDLTYALHLERAQCQWLSGNLEAAWNLLAEILPRAKSLADQLEVSRLQVELQSARGEWEPASETTLAACGNVLGIEWELHPSQAYVRRLAEEVRQELGGREIDDLLALPVMADMDMKAAMGLLAACLPAAYYTTPTLNESLVCHMVRLSLRHGNAYVSPMAYAIFGALIGQLLGNWPEALRWGELARRLVERPSFAGGAARVYQVLGLLLKHRIQPLRQVLVLFRIALRSAMETGDLQFASYSATSIVIHRLTLGDPLSEVAREAEAGLDFMRRAKYGIVHDCIASMYRLAQTLRGEPFSGPDLEPGQLEARLMGLSAWYYHLYDMQAKFLLGDDNGALAATADARKHTDLAKGMMVEAEYSYYAALTLAAGCESATPRQREELLADLSPCRELLRQWAETCPANYLGRHDLVCAEISRITGEDTEAMRLYEQAIRSARKNAFIQDEGVAYELTSRFYRSRGFEMIADACLREARSCFARWGADAKVRQLDSRYAHLLKNKPAAATATVALQAGQLELLSAAKATQAISSEIVIEVIVQTLLRLVMEQGGAQKAYLILSHDGALSIEAEATLNEKGVRAKILQKLDVDDSGLVPGAIVRYVQRTKERVVLSDAAVEAGKFSSDPYIVKQRPKSLLCLPVIWRTEMAGLLYLENNLLSGAFAQDKLAVLELLASQAAISLGTATLYSALQTSQQQLQGIFDYSSAIIFAKQPDGRYLFVNRRYEMLVHRSKDEIIGKTDYELWPKEAAAAFTANDHLALEAGKPVTYEETVPQEDGPHTYVAVKFSLCDTEGKPYAVCGIATDISDRKRAEEEIRRLNLDLERRVAERTAELTAANKELDSFAQSVSHDLRSPLRKINAFSQLLDNYRGEKLDATARDYLQRIRASTRLMEQLIEDLLELSRTVRVEMRREQVDLSALALAITQELREAEPQRRVQLVITPNLLAEGDSRLLQVVLQNLMLNAWKFTSKHPSARIEFGATQVSGETAFYVRDDGAGFDMAQAPRLFGAFQRLHTSMEFPGTGIGLATVQRIINRHGGRIWAEAAPEKGATFFFTLSPMGRRS